MTSDVRDTQGSCSEGAEVVEPRDERRFDALIRQLSG